MTSSTADSAVSNLLASTTRATTNHEQSLPIDIDYIKFLDWLVDRNRVPNNWHSLLKTARTLARTAFSQTPISIHSYLPIPSCLYFNDITQNIPYFTAKDILQTLLNDPPQPIPTDWPSTTEKDLLGRYKHSLLRSWADAILAFEKKSVYLADLAQHLVRITDIDAKVIKTEITKFSSEVVDLAKRENPAIRSAADANKRYLQACQYHGLVDDNQIDFETQLKDYINQKVPQLLTDGINLCRTDWFVKAVEYYEIFSRGICIKNKSEKNKIDDLLKKVMNEDVNKLIRNVQNDNSQNNGINWGDMMTFETDHSAPIVSEETTADIDWGIELGSSGVGTNDVVELNTDEIEQNMSSLTQNSQPVDTGTNSGIDWDIKVSNGMSTDQHGQAEIVKTEEVVTLADGKTREDFFRILLKLQGFLTQRIEEMSESESRNYESGMMQQRIGGMAANIDLEKVEKMLNAVNDSIQGLNGNEARRILELQKDGKRIQRIAKEVLRQKHRSIQMESNVETLRRRRNEMGTYLQEENDKLKDLNAYALQVKRRTEEAISVLYNSRQVNVLGEINNVFGKHLT